MLAATLGGCSTGRDAATDDPMAGDSATPGFEAREAEIVETGPDGAPRYRVSARTITQDPASRAVRLDAVQMRVEDDADGRWDIAAASGLMPAEADAIELSGDVRIRGAQEGGRGPLEIRGEQIRYEFEPALARSSREVTIFYSGHQLSALGLEARLKERRVRLESKVHGRFNP
jgi:LPS export ABC transporter protein LptC